MDWSATEIEIEEALLPVELDVFLARHNFVQGFKRMTCALKGLGASTSEACDGFRRFADALRGSDS